jgi:type I restriction enzyme S subunit
MKASLGSLIRLHYGKALKSEDRDSSGTIPVFGSNGRVGTHTHALFTGESIVIGRKGSVGKITYAPCGGWIIDTAFYAEIIDTNLLMPRYLFHALRSLSLEDRTITTSIPGINRDDIYSQKISVPILAEQQHVASILDKVETARSKRQEAISLMDNIVKSQFIEMFGDPTTNTKGWETAKWSEIFNTTTGKLDSNAMVENGEYPFFTCAKEIFTIDKYAFDCEALLLAGNNAAGIYDVKYYAGKFNAYQRTYVITLKNDNFSYHIFKFLLEHKLEHMRKLSKGTNTKYLTMGILNDILFILPPPLLQNHFADFVRAADKSTFTMRKELNDLEALNKALIQQYFQ